LCIISALVADAFLALSVVTGATGIDETAELGEGVYVTAELGVSVDVTAGLGVDVDVTARLVGVTAGLGVGVNAKAGLGVGVGIGIGADVRVTFPITVMISCSRASLPAASLATASITFCPGVVNLIKCLP